MLHFNCIRVGMLGGKKLYNNINHRTMMYGSKWAESEPNAVIKINDISFEAFELIKSYVYNLPKHINVANCVSLYYASKKYLIEPLYTMVEKYMFDHVDATNVLHLLNECEKYNLSNELGSKLMQHVQKNNYDCEKILQSQAFLECSPGDIFLCIYKSFSLNIYRIQLSIKSMIIPTQVDICLIL